MPDIIYDVAVSADGFICGPKADVSAFPAEGRHVDAYLERVTGYATVIMGRRTYEFGYAYGLAPGDNPYPHAKTFVFSTRLGLPAGAAVTQISCEWGDRIAEIKARSTGPIYLCGGGAFAGWTLERGLIDRLRLKRAPIVLGDGVRLFGACTRPATGQVVASESWQNGVAYCEVIL